MELSQIVDQYSDELTNRYQNRLLPSHIKALNAIKRCRTPDSGELYVECQDCHHAQWRPLSCGNRNCPQCQNHVATQWLDRQKAKLLPVEYFMVTFTLPFELRKLVWHNQKSLYAILFSCVKSTLKDFGLNHKHLGADLGMTAVLHAHSRRLDFHPHIHVVVPGGGINKLKRQWIKLKGKFLFNEFALAKVFRARFLAAVNKQGFTLPIGVPPEWVVDCRHVGKGLPALKYLSRYLYRGVISEKNIVSNKNGQVTFKYIDSNTGKTEYRCEKGADFLWLVLQPVLPTGFRRVRDFGFLHHNAKKTLVLIQLILRVFIAPVIARSRPVFKCCRCQSEMMIKSFRWPTRSG